MAIDSTQPAELPVMQAELASHRHHVQAEAPLENVQRDFVRLGVEFLAVVDGDRLVGLCARREVAEALGARFGFALNAQRPVRFFLMQGALKVPLGLPLPQVFRLLAARGDGDFFDDVLLVDGAGGLVGLVHAHTLVRLQTTMLAANIEALEASRQEIVEQNRRMEDDLRMAREVQLALMPAEHPPVTGRCGTLRLAHRYRPAGGVSGDFFEALNVGEGAMGLLICDVMGHGVRSALITAMVRAMVEELRPQAADPAALLTRMNTDLTKLLRRTGDMIFVTAAYVVADASAGRLRYALAGHPVPLIAQAGTGGGKPLDRGRELVGPALGLLDEFNYDAGEEPLGPGDRVLLYTDGIFEAANALGAEFGQDRLAEVFGRAASGGLDGVLVSLVEAAEKFSGGAEGFADDVCLLAAGLES